MIVVGGVYYEQCVSPEWNNFYGSGGRAAAALSGFGTEVTLHTFAPADFQEQIRDSFAAYTFNIEFHLSDACYGFYYLHALSRPTFYAVPTEPTHRSEFDVEGNVVVRFGFMEGSAKVIADYAVYDPQSPHPEMFRENGSQAKHLAYVLNQAELEAMYPGRDLDSAARLLIQQEAAEVALIKRGVFGVRVITNTGIAASLPAYQTAHVFKIGSGDVFSAAFAYYWAVHKLSPTEAASLALSRPLGTAIRAVYHCQKRKYYRLSLR